MCLLCRCFSSIGRFFVWQMIVNLVLFSGIYYMKVNDPENDFLALKEPEHMLLDGLEEEEEGVNENRDNYDVDPRWSNASGANQNVTTAFDRSTSICSDAHLENLEKVRTLSFV
jgi:hypothetical protein